MFRASQHILFLLACVADDKVTVSDEEALNELKEAKAHWDARVTSEAVSTATTEKSKLIGKAIDEAIAEYIKWTKDNRTANLRDLAHRIAQNAADLDRELVGIRDSDPGTSL
jgi:hypothetical protein